MTEVAGRERRGIVLVTHGGQSASTAPVTATQLAVLRMIPIAAAIRRAVSADGIEVRRRLFAVRGWNGAQASPVADLTRILDELHARSAKVPVVLVGHSMGARAALRAAGHPAVIAVVGTGTVAAAEVSQSPSSPGAACCSRTAPPTASPARPTPGPTQTARVTSAT